MRENPEQKRRRAGQVLERLRAAWPQARIALRFSGPLELLVAVILSAQCTDERVNRVTPGLFARFRRPEDYAGAAEGVLEEAIRSCGLYRAKARALRGACRAIVERHEGQVPGTRAALAELPGVGNKTAGVVALHLTGEPAFPVDTHVARLAQRLGFTRERAPDRIEADLCRLYPPEQWGPAHHALIWHGRGLCTARSPRCPECPVERLCPKRGVARRYSAGRS